jgi:hypothetical protein
LHPIPKVTVHPHAVVDLQHGADMKLQPPHCDATHVHAPPLHGTLALHA